MSMASMLMLGIVISLVASNEAMVFRQCVWEVRGECNVGGACAVVECADRIAADVCRCMQKL